MATSTEKLAAISDRHAAQQNSILTALVKALVLLWGDWTPARDQDAVTGIAARSSNLVLSATGQTRLLQRSFMTAVLREMRVPAPSLPKLVNTYPRANVSPLEVYQRPASTLIWNLSQGASFPDAADAAKQRLEELAQLDVQAADRAESAIIRDHTPRIVGTRRIIHPELSQDGRGTCALCVAASTRFYKATDLRPLHAGCHCSELPITSDEDPGLKLNDADLQTLYAAAGGSTFADSLREVRVKYVEHGELGPLLVKAGDHWRTPDEAGRPKYKPLTPERQREQYARNRTAAEAERARLDNLVSAINKQLGDVDLRRLTPEQEQLVRKRTTAAQSVKNLGEYIRSLDAGLKALAA